ncbi:CpsB/CapC family capsule biosynthesis tyrosine phosphatase [Eubacteriaceae bacterium ES2]|nr:CpsB/CapC family capsule biosynthesis tyrosine phosphatase [Eubacteriaceae bacterium ES2]
MIDIHTHILPGVDDGARNFEESMKMLEKATELGFDALVMTPHYHEDKNMIIRVPEHRLLLKRIKKAARARGIALYMFLGNEIYFSSQIMADIDKDHFKSLNQSRYILVEASRQNLNCCHFERFLINLKAKGYTPVIAHPERYSCIQENPNLLRRMIGHGCLAQLNLLSLAGFHGDNAQDTAEILLTHQMIHFAASDAHKPRYYDMLPNAMAIAADLIGRADFDRLMDQNPKRLLVNETIWAPQPLEYTPKPRRTSLLMEMFIKKRSD